MLYVVRNDGQQPCTEYIPTIRKILAAHQQIQRIETKATECYFWVDTKKKLIAPAVAAPATASSGMY